MAEELFQISGYIAHPCDGIDVVYFRSDKPVLMVVNVFNASSSCDMTVTLRDKNGQALVSETIILPDYVAVEPNGKRAYVVDRGSGGISVIDVRTNTKIAEFTDIGEASGMVVLDVQTNTIISEVVTGPNPVHAVIPPDGNRAYVANNLPGFNSPVIVLDLMTNTQIVQIPAGDGSLYIAAAPDGKCVYVTNNNQNTVSVIDTRTNTKIKDIPVGDTPIQVVVTPDGKLVLVSNFGDMSLSAIDAATNTKIGDIQVGMQPGSIAVLP